MLTFPNFISLCRVPLAFAFIDPNPVVRTIALALAMATDILDGFLARRNKQTSQLGAFLDPLTDKFFVIFGLTLLLGERSIEVWKIVSFLCRDLAVLVFGCVLALQRRLGTYQLRSIICGKISTFLQMMVLVSMVWKYGVPSYIYICFIVLGLFALFELFWNSRSAPQKIQG